MVKLTSDRVPHFHGYILLMSTPKKCDGVIDRISYAVQKKKNCQCNTDSKCTCPHIHFARVPFEDLALQATVTFFTQICVVFPLVDN